MVGENNRVSLEFVWRNYNRLFRYQTGLERLCFNMENDIDELGAPTAERHPIHHHHRREHRSKQPKHQAEQDKTASTRPHSARISNITPTRWTTDHLLQHPALQWPCANDAATASAHHTKSSAAQSDARTCRCASSAKKSCVGRSIPKLDP